jgi:hypothetical protein
VIFRRHYIPAVTNTYRTANLTRHPDFSAAVRSFDDPLTQSKIRYLDPANPAPLTATMANPFPAPVASVESEGLSVSPLYPDCSPRLEYKTTAEPYSYPGSSIQYLIPPDSVNETQEDIGLSYPALPGVASVAPSTPIQFSTVSPLESVALPTRVEQSVPGVAPPLADPVVVIASEPTHSVDPVVPIPSDPPRQESLPEPVSPLAVPVPIPPLPAASAIYHPNILLVDPEEEEEQQQEVQRQGEEEFALPEVPTDIPFLFPEAPAHMVHLEHTEARTRGVEVAPSDSPELSHRAVAMSGRSPNPSNPSPPSPNLTRLSPPSVSMSTTQPQVNEAAAYPTLPSMPVPTRDLVAIPIDSTTRSPSLASVSQLILDLPLIIISPLSLLSSLFPSLSA